MKKFNLLLVATIIASFAIIFGCNKRDSTVDIFPESVVENPYNFVGELHNAGLDAVLGALQDTKSSQISSEIIEKLTNDFCDKVFCVDERFYTSSVTKSIDSDISDTFYYCVL